MKKKYGTPVAEMVDFNYEENVVASGSTNPSSDSGSGSGSSSGSGSGSSSGSGSGSSSGYTGYSLLGFIKICSNWF